MDDVVLRLATAADAPVLAETVRLGFESYRGWAPRGWDPPPPTVHLAGIRTRVEAPGTWCLLAEQGGEPAGHAAITPAARSEEPRAPIAGLAHLWMLFIRERWWGTGLAAELLGRALTEAAARGYEAMRLLTPAGHARARAFYEREGWVVSAAPFHERGLGLDLVEYRRPLAPPNGRG